MRKHTRLLRAILASLAALILGIAYSTGWAEEDAFDVAKVFFELNDTDGDLGIHAHIDGEPWKVFTMEDPEKGTILKIDVSGRLQNQGLTELFFESAEPPFESDESDEATLTPEEFFNRFPEGIYTMKGETLEGEALQSESELTHTMPAPPEPTVNGKGLAEECDPDDPEYDAPQVSTPVTIEWAEVTTSHPDLGTMPAVAVSIHNYEIVVEFENADGFVSVLSVILPPGSRSMTIPAEFIALGKTFKYEILAREKSYNQTAVENCFRL